VSGTQKFQVWRQKDAARRWGPSPGAKKQRRPLPPGRGDGGDQLLFSDSNL